MDKPPAMLAVSPKGTVPVVIDVDGNIIEESRDAMRWALEKNDPDAWLDGLGLMIPRYRLAMTTSSTGSIGKYAVRFLNRMRSGTEGK